jgi:hypothetical protein
MDVLHVPQNTFKITEIYAYVSVDADGNEGVCAFTSGTTINPMIAADPKRLEQLEPIAKALAGMSPYPIKLVKFNVREEVREIKTSEA